MCDQHICFVVKWQVIFLACCWCRYCKEADNTVAEFKAAVQKAEANCRLISETMLLKVERKRMYDHREFAAQQAEHHVKVRCTATPHALSSQHKPPFCFMHDTHEIRVLAHNVVPPVVSDAWSDGTGARAVP